MVEAQSIHPIETIEMAIPSCPDFEKCRKSRDFSVQLSRIQPRDARRGPYDAKILIVTESPDPKSIKGQAYSGTTGTRIMNMFLKEEYVICLDYDFRAPRYILRFLIENGIYRTSAVKCGVNGDGGSKEVPPQIVQRCRRRFLDGQIRCLKNLELIVPMGRVAIASVLHRHPKSISVQRLLGRRGEGILSNDHIYGKKLVVLPHPSGMNPLFNPPVRRRADTITTIRKKWQFYQALSALREFLEILGYRLRRKSPTVEESFKGYFS